jgi:alkanesulfonate monooxygenase SsuD/methylene tetrahydromethanopterin reductase-like flavin-dependent oxidoreductase (luciferase family)
VQERIPVVIGGGGAKRTPRLAAIYADEFNLPFGSVEDTSAQFGRVREAAAQTGRHLVLSAAQIVCVGRTEDEVARRAAAIGREPDELRRNGLAGTVDEVVEKVGRFAGAGATRLYLQVMDLADLEHVELIAAEVAPQVG